MAAKRDWYQNVNITFDIKFSLTVETTVFNSQQLFPSCLQIYIIYSLPVLH